MTVRELEVISRLEALHANKLACENLPERIAMMENRLTAIKTAKYDGEPVSGGTSKGEDMKIEMIIERDLAKQDLAYAQAEVEQLEKALKQLSKNERITLERFHVTRQKDHVRRLCDELGYEEAQIYRIHKSGLYNLACILYGTRRT